MIEIDFCPRAHQDLFIHGEDSLLIVSINAKFPISPCTEKFVSLFFARNLIEASLIKNELEAHKIAVRILNENMATLYPHVDAVAIEIQVPETNKQEALKVIRKYKR